MPTVSYTAYRTFFLCCIITETKSNKNIISPLIFYAINTGLKGGFTKFSFYLWLVRRLRSRFMFLANSFLMEVRRHIKFF